jgi:hypothetical protein
MFRRLIVLLLLIIVLPVNKLYAQEEATTSGEIEYQLAYPGILPDHMLYKVKVLRDKLQSFLISTPKNKISFFLNQADKGMFATLLLSEKQKGDLAVETALKAEHNMTLVNTQISQMSEKPEQELFNNLKTAHAKHQETLNSAKSHLNQEQQKTIDTVLEFSQRNELELQRYETIVSDRWNIDK